MIPIKDSSFVAYLNHTIEKRPGVKEPVLRRELADGIKKSTTSTTGHGAI